jgi:DNA invertase Pin-like site-specific DNA recombinase
MVAKTPAQQVRAGCYCRISSDPNDKRAGVDRQREDTTTMCEVTGWTPVGFYIDNDRSADRGKYRPQWDRLLADIKAGKIDAIVVWNQDRGWRMMSEFESLRPQLEPLGVRLATTNIGVIDFRNADDIFRAQVSTAMSEMEIAKMRVRIQRAARQKAERGAPNWSRAFGYAGTSREPDPVTAPLVAKAYRDILAGVSLSAICRDWNARGVTTVNGKPWTASLLTKFLRKPRNAGLRTYKDNPYGPTNREAVVGKGDWLPLVKEATFWAAQRVLDAPGRAPGRKAVRRHLLTGVARCGKPGCGSTLAASYRKDQIIYVCKACHGVSILADNLEPEVFMYVVEKLAQADAVDLLNAKIHDEAEAEAIRTELDALYAERRDIGIERGKRLLTGEQAKIATDLINEDIKKLERRQEDEERRRIFEGLPLGTPQVAEAIERLSPDRFRAILDVLAVVTVMPVGKIGRGPVPDRVDIDDRRVA